MKKMLVGILAAAVILAFVSTSYAKDKEWATAGKVLAVIEGARILTGGSLDIFGNVAGINNGSGGGLFNRARSDRYYERGHARNNCFPQTYTRSQVWVPNYVWERKYLPEHEEYVEGYGNVIVEGCYIRYQVEQGGHWE